MNRLKAIWAANSSDPVKWNLMWLFGLQTCAAAIAGVTFFVFIPSTATYVMAGHMPLMVVAIFVWAKFLRRDEDLQ